MNRFVGCLLAGAVLALAAPAEAQYESPSGEPVYGGPQQDPQQADEDQSGFHRHDGFFLQLTQGYAGVRNRGGMLGQDATISGSGRLSSLAIGGSISENVTVAGEIWGMGASDPRFTSRSGSTTGGAFALIGIGLNLTYYFMPANVYVSIVPSVAGAAASIGAMPPGFDSTTAKGGWAMRLGAGKEWWVSENWGLGVSLQYAHGSTRGDKSGTMTAPSAWSTNLLGLSLSATYN